MVWLAPFGCLYYFHFSAIMWSVLLIHLVFRWTRESNSHPRTMAQTVNPQHLPLDQGASPDLIFCNDVTNWDLSVTLYLVSVKCDLVSLHPFYSSLMTVPIVAFLGYTEKCAFLTKRTCKQPGSAKPYTCVLAWDVI